MPQQKITQIAREHSGNYIGIYPSGHLLLQKDAKILFDYDGGIISGKDTFFPEDTNFGGNVYLDKISGDWQKGISIGSPKNFFDYLSEGRFSTYSQNLYGTLIAQDSDYMFVGLLDSGSNSKTSVIGFGDDYGSDKLEFIFFDYATSTVKTIMTVSTGGILINQDSQQSTSPVTNDRLNASGSYILDKAILDSDISSNGLMVRTSNGHYVSRSISVDNSLSISYADGVNANPSISISTPYKTLINNSVQITGNQTIEGLKSFSNKIQTVGEVVVRATIGDNNKFIDEGVNATNLPGHFESLFQNNLFGARYQWDTDYLFIGLNNSGIDKKRATIGFGDNYGTDSLDFVFFDYDSSQMRSLFSITTGGIYIGNGQEIVSKYYIDTLFEQSIHDSDFSINGLMTRTSNGVYVSRKIFAGSGISVENGNGVADNPVVGINYNTYEKINSAILDTDIVSNGFISRMTYGQYVPRSITAGNGISVDYGDGVSANPYLYIDSYNHDLIYNSIQTTGNQSINGVKDFSLSPIIPIGDSSGEAINYNQFIESGNYIHSLIDDISSTGISKIMTDLSTLSGNLLNTGEYLSSLIQSSSSLSGAAFDLFYENISSIMGDVIVANGSGSYAWATLGNNINVNGVKINNELVLSQRQPGLKKLFTNVNEFSYTGTNQSEINEELKYNINILREQLNYLAEENRLLKHGLVSGHHLFELSYEIITISGEPITISGNPLTINIQ